MTLADDYNLRAETARMNDVADFVDLFDVPQSWTPTLSVTAPMTLSTPVILYSAMYIVGDLHFMYMRATASIGGTSRNLIFATLPFTSVAASYHPVMFNYGQPSTGYFGGMAFTDGASITMAKPDRSEFTVDTIDLNLFGVIRT